MTCSKKRFPSERMGTALMLFRQLHAAPAYFLLTVGIQPGCFPRSDLPWSPSWAVDSCPARLRFRSEKISKSGQSSTELPYVPGSTVRPCSPAAQGDEAPYNKASHIFQFPRQHCRVSLHASRSPFHAGKSSVFPDIQAVSPYWGVQSSVQVPHTKMPPAHVCVPGAKPSVGFSSRLFRERERTQQR